MFRNLLSALFLTSLLTVPAMAQEVPAEAGVPPVLAAREKRLVELSVENRELSAELMRRRAEIVRDNPEVSDRIAQERARAGELRLQAVELRKEAAELDRQAAEIVAQSNVRAFAEVDPDFAQKSQRQAELMVEIATMREEMRLERDKKRQESYLKQVPTHSHPVAPPQTKPAAEKANPAE